MKMMNELLLEKKFRLNNFQQETRLQLSQLRDEIASVKNTISLANQQSTDKVQTISQSTDKLSKDMKQANDAFHRKLQSVHDTIKKITPSTANMVERLVQNERSERERATTETTQSEKIIIMKEKRENSLQRNKNSMKILILWTRQIYQIKL
ncbi:hypothetical protein DPMN_015390 [Dreissena polymorpha]|uniref:Uncharacterized protein n=1 Tax=Dreissena polymorpha TaxID=45954 RepID=A0A9D4NDJ5_DREPO|nr:hypothetical protein DPMN_015390 [Dreissena polymorpha]